MKKAALALRRKTPCRKSAERARPVEVPVIGRAARRAHGAKLPGRDLRHPGLMVLCCDPLAIALTAAPLDGDQLRSKTTFGLVSRVTPVQTASGD
jgi:hypothetical protein